MMAAPIPIEIRACMLEAHFEGATQVEISERFNVSQSAVSKLLAKYERDQHLVPGKAKGAERIIHTSEHSIIRDIVREKPDITLAGIREEILHRLNKSVCITSVWNIVERLNLRRKRKSRYAEERDRPDIKKKKRLY